MVTGHLTVTLANGAGGADLGFNFYVLRIIQVTLRDLFDWSWHCCREQSCLTFFWRVAQDQFNIVNEAHTQHFIGFVQYQKLQFIQL